MMGCDYKLEKMVENEWQSVPEIIDNVAWTAEAYMIKNGDVTEFEVDWNWLYGEMEAGTYRISKSIMYTPPGSLETATYYVKFDIK